MLTVQKCNCLANGHVLVVKHILHEISLLSNGAAILSFLETNHIRRHKLWILYSVNYNYNLTNLVNDIVNNPNTVIAAAAAIHTHNS